jgi:hypothetical protein
MKVAVIQDATVTMTGEEMTAEMTAEEGEEGG